MASALRLAKGLRTKNVMSLQKQSIASFSVSRFSQKKSKAQKKADVDTTGGRDLAFEALTKKYMNPNKYAETRTEDQLWDDRIMSKRFSSMKKKMHNMEEKRFHRRIDMQRSAVNSMSEEMKKAAMVPDASEWPICIHVPYDTPPDEKWDGYP